MVRIKQSGTRMATNVEDKRRYKMTTRYSLVTVREEKSKEAIINLEGTAQRWLGMEKIYKDL